MIRVRNASLNLLSYRLSEPVLAQSFILTCINTFATVYYESITEISVFLIDRLEIFHEISHVICMFYLSPFTFIQDSLVLHVFLGACTFKEVEVPGSMFHVTYIKVEYISYSTVLYFSDTDSRSAEINQP